MLKEQEDAKDKFSAENRLNIISGTLKQAEHLSHDLHLHRKQWRYIDEPDKLRGMGSRSYYCLYGTYYEQRQWYGIRIELHISRMKQLKINSKDN